MVVTPVQADAKYWTMDDVVSSTKGSTTTHQIPPPSKSMGPDLAPAYNAFSHLPRVKQKLKGQKGRAKQQISLHGLKLGSNNKDATRGNLVIGFWDMNSAEKILMLQKGSGCCSRVADCLCCISSFSVSLVCGTKVDTVLSMNTSTFVTGGAWIIGNFPQGTISDMVSDASEAMSFICNNVVSFAGDPNKIYLMGQSAGAHITACALLEQAIKEPKGENTYWNVAQIKAYFGLSGGYNIQNLVDHFHERGVFIVKYFSGL
ncbi:putative isoprenylcysteine alpha-carbonyl methylesterase ICME [Zea mays]|uniref:protein-S-isoprenylcysteine alpha-carbonyl methylesterase n=1 Tax=Zea mays TaxID=4577 RepID=A0A3L6FAW5_MAIZE|nr:putative isoprenylcysteine alpha-carbonyl methylesterase ICME [Zea mays]